MLRSEILPVYKREMKAYLHSPATYVSIGLFLWLVGLLFFASLAYFVEESSGQVTGQGPTLNLMLMVVQGMFGLIYVLMLFVVPVLTMRLFSEEKRLGSFELLVTCPLRDSSILAGKFLAGLTVSWAALAMTVVYLLVLQAISGKGMIEWPAVGVAYLGSALVILAFVSLGVFASSVTENQMLAAILALIGLFAFLLIGDLPLARNAELFGVRVADVLEQISINPHMESFFMGMIRLADVSYFILFSAFFLILTTKILEARRWRV